MGNNYAIIGALVMLGGTLKTRMGARLAVSICPCVFLQSNSNH